MKPTLKPEEANIPVKDSFLKNKEDASTQLLFHFALEYAITKL
jgi:hypothetical protein